jgi:hypothetical protein
MQKLIRGAIAATYVFTACMLCTPAHAIENNLPTLIAIPATVVEGDRFSLQLSGTSPDGCGFARDSVKIVADVITVVFVRGGGASGVCTQVLTPFRFPITVFDAGAAAKAGTYKVRIELAPFNRNDQTVNKLLAFGLVPVTAPGKRAIVPENGQWNFEEGGPYPTSGSGISFNMERQNDALVSITSFYNSDGSPEWYINSGQTIAHTLNSSFYTVSGGQTLFGTYRAVKEVQYSGDVQLEFNSPAHGTAWYTQPIDAGLVSGLKLMPISITRFNFGYGAVDRALRGRWAFFNEEGGVESVTLALEPVGSANSSASNYAAGPFRLNCDRNIARPALLPERCTLTKNAAILATFDQVGYDRIRGLDGEKHAVSLFRLDAF